LRYAQNLHIPVSGLPAELLSDAFLYVIESGIQNDGARFSVGTFNFLQVCRRWNEVAIAFPQLWVRWTPGAVKAWPLFSSRSKAAPLFLTWQPRLPDSARDALTDTETPRRIRQLNFSGSGKELERLLGALDSTSISITSSIQLHSTYNETLNPGENLTRFLSMPFPKLSKLDIENFLLDSSSSIFTTSNLTSLKLNFPNNDNRRYTQSRLSQILQHHPNLQELDLRDGTTSPAEQSGAPVPIVLPQLVDLRLHGTTAVVAGFADLVSMVSPLHNFIINFQHTYNPTLPSFTDTSKKILKAYYECPGLDPPRTANRLSVSSDLPGNTQTFAAGSRSTPASSLKLQFYGMGIASVDIVPIFPSKHLREFTADWLELSASDWRKILQGMKSLLHLRLSRLDIEPVLEALDVRDGVYRKATRIMLNHSYADS
jgi:hypothetical protein